MRTSQNIFHTLPRENLERTVRVLIDKIEKLTNILATCSIKVRIERSEPSHMDSAVLSTRDGESTAQSISKKCRGEKISSRSITLGAGREDEAALSRAPRSGVGNWSGNGVQGELDLTVRNVYAFGHSSFFKTRAHTLVGEEGTCWPLASARRFVSGHDRSFFRSGCIADGRRE